MRGIRGWRRTLAVGACALAVWGCGSTSNDDELVLRFVRFDNTGLTQEDAVRDTSADVDIVQDLCQSGTTVTAEPYTQTVVNAVFENDEAADIQLERMHIDIGPTSGRAPIDRAVHGTIVGGRCSTVERRCATDADCSVAGGSPGICTHSQTTINGVLLFDFTDKAHVLPGTYNVAITFFGSDALQSFQVRTIYAVTFVDLNNCP